MHPGLRTGPESRAVKMEANRDAANELRRGAREAALAGDLLKAVRLLERSVRLYQVDLTFNIGSDYPYLVFIMPVAGAGSRSRIARNEDAIHKCT
jgi:hypothetical protein